MFETHFTGNFKGKKVRMRFKEDIEPQEILLDSLAQKKEREFDISEKKFEVPLQKTILYGFLLCSFGIILILFGRTFQLQVIEGKNFLSLSEQNKFKINQIQAERGVIYDKDFNQLVFNKPTFDLVCNKNNFSEAEAEKEKILKDIAQIIKKDFGDLKKQIDESEIFSVLISENLDHETLIALETKIEDFPGFQIVNNAVREYKDGNIFSHLIGYTGKIKSEEYKKDSDFYAISDYIGRDGIEKSYEETLRKNPGKLRIERDALGNMISKEIIQSPESGKSLVLWLDSDLQKKIKEELEKKLQELGGQKALAVAMDPQTGAILSLVSLPSYDNNIFFSSDSKALGELFNDKNQPLFDRVISGKYLTGSTIKPLIASAVLQEKIIDPNKSIDCEGFISIPNQYNPEQPTKKLDWATHAFTNFKKALAESCDVYFYTVGGGYENQKGLGPTKIKEYLELFGWNQKTGIDLPGETAGFIPDKQWKKEVWKTNWWDGDTYNMAIGQGFLQITPIEVTTSIAAIANGGKLLQPQVAKSVVDSEKNVIQEFGPKIIKENFIAPENLKIVREGMRQAVTGVNSPQASSVLLNSLPVSVAAKTGTAELGKDYYNNWITLFAPYDNPQIVLTIMFENIKGVQTAALPVAKEVLQWYFSEAQSQ